MLNNTKLRAAVETDYKLLANLGLKTFKQAYSGTVRSRDMNLYVKKAFSKNNILKELKDKSFTIFVALKNNKIVGYAKLLESRIPESSKNFKGIELVRLYVLKNYQRQKIGAKLLEECIKTAKKSKFKFLWLGVWEKNYNAIVFYKKFNFGTVIHNDLLMRKKLS